jgi:hypothetical protein
MAVAKKKIQRSKKQAVKAPTAAMIREMNEIRERRLELQREIDVMKRREDGIKKELTNHVDTKGGKRRSVKIGGYVVSLVPGKVYVSWKNEFIRVAGTDEAERVSANTTPRDKLEIKMS